MIIQNTYTKYTAALVMGVALSFLFVTSAYAQNDTTTTPAEDPVSTTQVDTAAQSQAEIIKALRAQVKVLKDQVKNQRATNANRLSKIKELRADNRADKKSDRKAERRKNMQEFKASLEGLTDDERKAAMVAYVTDLKAQVAQKKADRKIKKADREANKDARVVARKSERADFKASLEGLSMEDKFAVLLKRFAELQQRATDRGLKLDDRFSNLDGDDDGIKSEDEDIESDDEDESDEEDEEDEDDDDESDDEDEDDSEDE